MENCLFTTLISSVEDHGQPIVDAFYKNLEASGVSIAAYGSGSGPDHNRTLISFDSNITNGVNVRVDGLSDFVDKIDSIQIDNNGNNSRTLVYDGERYYINEIDLNPAATYNRISVFVKSTVAESFTVPSIKSYYSKVRQS